MRYTSDAISRIETFLKEGGLNSTDECFEDSLTPVFNREGVLRDDSLR